MVPTHSHAMRIKKATLSKRLMGFTMILFPVRTIGIRMRMNATGRSHNKPNNKIGKSSWKLRLFINSRIMNGSTRIELMIAGDLRFIRTFFIKPRCGVG